MKTKAETSVKWVSKFNLGDTVRHKADVSEKGIITHVRFSMTGPLAAYLVSKGARDIWWLENEIVRVIGVGI